MTGKVITAVLAVLVCTACSTGQKEPEIPETPLPAPEIEVCPQPVFSAYEFQRHVLPEEIIRIYGAEFEREFHAFCDAVSEGTDAFPCTSARQFHLIMSAARTCFPFALKWVDEDGTAVRNGTAYLIYKGTPEEVREDFGRFARKVTDIISEAVPYEEPDEIRAMELLTYIAHKDIFDENHTLDDMLETGPYRAIMNDIGICQEIAGEYIYCLLQLGINAFPCASLTADKSGAHEWVMAEFDGKYYHIDPTYTITYPDSLFFFGMNDLQREYYGDFPPEWYSYGDIDLSAPETYAAEDDRFLNLWLAESYEIDHECRKIRIRDHNTGEISVLSYEPGQ